jgi:hypothetical protein
MGEKIKAKKVYEGIILVHCGRGKKSFPKGKRGNMGFRTNQ